MPNKKLPTYNQVSSHVFRANMDPVDKNQCTPLFYAATLGHLDCLKMLLDLGADSNHTDTRGRTVVHCAVVSGSTEALQMLSEYNIDLWSRNVKGDQPIHEAAQSGHIDILVYLLEHSDDHHDVIDSPNGDGRTCLHIAALTNNLWLCKTLLDNHANVNAIMSNKGKYYTPLDVAVIKSHYDIRDLLTAQGGRPGHSIVDHAAETIQVKYKYHKKHSHHPEAPPDAHQQDHLEPRRSPLQSESHNTYPAAAAEDGPKYVDKSTQIRTKPVNKNLRKPYDDSAVEEQIHTKTSDTPKQFQKSGETERVKKTVSKDLTPVTETSSISQQSSSSHKRILSKQERIRQASQSVECKTPSEKSTSHGNTSDIESSSGDPVQTKAKAKRTLKSRRGKTSRYSDSSVEKNSSRGETEVDTSKSLSFPSLSEDSFSHDKGNSARDKGRKSKPSQETSQETEELFALASTYRMGCGPSRAHPVQYAPNDEPNRAEERDAQEMNEIPNTQRNGHASNGRLQYRGRIVVRNRNSNQRPRNHIKIIIKKNHPRGSNVPSSAPTPGPSKRPSGHLPGIPSVPPSSRPSGRPSSPQSDSPSSRPSSRPSGPPSRSPMPPSSRPSGTPSSSPIPPSSRPSGSPQCRPSSRPSGPPSRSPIPPSSHPPGPPSDLPSGPSIVTPLGQSFSPPSSPPSARQSGPPKISHSSPYKRPTSDPETISPSGQAVSQQSNDEDHVTSPVRGSLNTEESAESPQSSEFPQHSPKKTSSNTNTRIQSVRATVKKFEAERRSIRQLQQIKRMMIHSSPIRNSITFQNLLYLYARGHYADIADTLRRCTEQVKRADRNNQTVHHDVSNGQAELDYAQNKHKNVQQREADKAGHFGHHHSKSMEETKRHKDVAIDIERRPQTSHVTRRSRPTQDNNGYYNDPRLPTSLRVIKERQRLSNLLLKEAYQPFGGVDIFTSTGSSQSETRPRGRPDSNISGSSNSSSNSNTRQPGNSVINGGRKTRTEEITREKKKPDSIEEE
ncbi:hypothetical protein Btru_069850 [Bulinus truncatus]|nr:hypothetical protein Btru_069850 [Bulinus truncatus]